MSTLFTKIKEHYAKQLPFVCYTKPNSDKIIVLLQNNDALYELNSDESGFAFVSFDNQQRYIIPENQSDIYFEMVSISDFSYPNTREFLIDESSKINFQNLVEKAVSEIEKGTFEKVVLSRNEIVSVSNFDFELVFNQLLINYPTAFKYCFYHPKVGFWMGATPEQLLKVEENRTKTVALAGTQLVTDLQNVEWKDKEVKEQQIVTDFIIESLKKHTNKVSKSEPYTFKAGTIVHLKTDIEAEIENSSDLEKILNELHPTPAVCGFPKDIAKQFILNNEGYERAFYAGFLGEWNKDFMTYKKGNSDLFVNLRCMKISGDKAELFIGCGINKGSNPEKEFIETVNKSQTMKKVL